MHRQLMLLVATLVARPAFAQGTADTLGVAEAVEIALAANPMLHAARLSADAARARVPQAGALPDPELQLGLMNRMAEDFGSTMDPMTMDQLQLMQVLPWPGKLGNAKRAARRTADAAVADAEEQARMLAARVSMAYYDVAAMDRALLVMRRTLRLLEDLAEVTTTMYAVGSVVQQDVLRAQLEIGRMTEDLARMGQDRLAAAARLNALLGREARTPVPALELPDAVGEPPPVDSLLALALARRPALRAGSERVEAAGASLAAARRELLPDVRLGVAYQRRSSFPDMMSVMVGVNLPIFAGARQVPMRREMAAVRDRAEAELLDLRNETIARIVETRARAERDRSLARLYRARILPLARASVDAALSSYRVGRVSFMTLVDNQMTVNRYEIDTYRLIADFHAAMAELQALTGGAP